MNEQPSPASTVVLLRDGMDGIETLLMGYVGKTAAAYDYSAPCSGT